ncbi:unnamed protein product [Rotaria magnacalcarata]|uniref:Sex-determining region Y protein n=1 Tax=Rotaria magnacalcarata TaxID=392030 RepID=A0A816YVF5_9BILA|nr:unnamed protein product [Rotaria magnacalcarata]CAF3846931.1 unnamed protein product [Rotaria magnacalcarata]
MSAPSSLFHDYLAMDSYLPKMEAMTPITTMEDQYEQTFEINPNTNINIDVDTTITTTTISTNNYDRSNRNSIVKRPMNAFLLWARGERKRISSDGYGVSQTSLSKLLGETWRHMSVEEKQPYLDMADTLKRQHHIDHPDYKFKPKQRSLTGYQKTVKTNHSFAPQKQLSTKISPIHHCTSSTSYSSQPSLPPISNVTPHPIQSNVLLMCQSIISLSPFDNNNDWFGQMIAQPQTVIVTPIFRTQTSPIPSRRAVRIQIINKHDDIALPSPTLLSMTPPPPSSLSSFFITESAPRLVDYLVDNDNIFSIPTSNSQQIVTNNMDDSIGYETLHDSSFNHLTDLDQHYDSSGWIDTPLSSFGTNSTDMVPSSPYTSYDFLCL